MASICSTLGKGFAALGKGMSSIGTGMLSIGEGMLSIGEGMASVFGGQRRDSYHVTSDEEAWEIDRKAMASDWEQVGKDVDAAMKKFKP